MPDIAVIIPMYNGSAYIAETLGSILGPHAESSAGPDVEVIISDDGSNDGSPELVRTMGDPRVRVVANKGKGVAAGLNTALELVTAPLVCRSDHDDHYTPGRLAWQVAFMREHPECGAVCGQLQTMTHEGEILAEMGSGDVGEEITGELAGGKIRTHLNTWASRTEIVRSLRGGGGFRSFGLSGEDNDFQLRMGEATRVWYEPRVFYRWRLHASSITHRQPSAERVWAERLAYVLQQQRRERGGVDDLMTGTLPPVPPDLTPEPIPRVEEQIESILAGAAWRAHAQGDRREALRQILRAYRRRPGSLGLLRQVGLIALRPVPRAGGSGPSRPVP